MKNTTTLTKQEQLKGVRKMKEQDKEKLSLEDLAEAGIEYCNMEWGDFCLKLKEAIFGNYDKHDFTFTNDDRQAVADCISYYATLT